VVPAGLGDDQDAAGIAEVNAADGWGVSPPSVGVACNARSHVAARDRSGCRLFCRGWGVHAYIAHAYLNIYVCARWRRGSGEWGGRREGRGFGGLEGDVFFGVDGCAFEPEFEVEVGSCGEFAGVSDEGDGFATDDGVAHAFEEEGVVFVDGYVAVFVLYFYDVAVLSVVAGEDDGTVECSEDVLLW